METQQKTSVSKKESRRRQTLIERMVLCPTCNGLCTPLIFDGTKQIGWACNVCPEPRTAPRISYKVSA